MYADKGCADLVAFNGLPCDILVSAMLFTVCLTFPRLLGQDESEKASFLFIP